MSQLLPQTQKPGSSRAKPSLAWRFIDVRWLETVLDLFL